MELNQLEMCAEENVSYRSMGEAVRGGGEGE
jgi:hypothetical protein